MGVNTGEVVVGRAREGSSFVSGDAVNVAARLEQSAGAGEILVGERTVAAVRGAFELQIDRLRVTQVRASGKVQIGLWSLQLELLNGCDAISNLNRGGANLLERIRGGIQPKIRKRYFCLKQIDVGPRSFSVNPE